MSLPNIDILSSDTDINEVSQDYVNDFHNKVFDLFEDRGISAEFSGIEVGPSILRIEYKVHSGTNLTKVRKLTDNISLATGVSNIKILTPVDGKPLIGIEFPRKKRNTVNIKDLINSEEFNSQDYKIPISIGQDVTGKDIVEDLASYPHLLVAGATGSGKSISMNAIIMSILYRFTADEMKLVMIDPKMVELSIYERIPHLFGGEVITNTEKAINMLARLTSIMDDRYEKLKANRVKDIVSYNAISEERMPYITVLIDEFADLMLTAKKEVEGHVTRLVSMARAVGIHLVIATQRPSVDVITGVIKANFPARMSFRVASNMDSRTIINQDGAQKLLGKGDMLLMTAKHFKPKRIQGTFVSTEEIKETVDFLVNNVEKVDSAEESNIHPVKTEENDIYASIKAYIRSKNSRVTSPALQREFKISLKLAKEIIIATEEEK